MASTAITLRNPDRASKIQCFGQSLPPRLRAAIDGDGDMRDLALPTPAERPLIDQAVAELLHAQQGAAPREIAMQLAKLAVAFPPARRSTNPDADDIEAAARLDVYRDALADIPPDILDDAVKACIRRLRFFPKVAEIRDAARRGMAIREYQIGRLKMLGARFDREYRPPEPPMTAEQRAEFQRLAKRLGVKSDER